jgi:hypothetical protein
MLLLCATAAAAWIVGCYAFRMWMRFGLRLVPAMTPRSADGHIPGTRLSQLRDVAQPN